MLWMLGFGVREAASPAAEMPPGLQRLGFALEGLPAQEERVRAAVQEGVEFFSQR
jgi:hypothetical protein